MISRKPASTARSLDFAVGLHFLIVESLFWRLFSCFFVEDKRPFWLPLAVPLASVGAGSWR